MLDARPTLVTRDQCVMSPATFCQGIAAEVADCGWRTGLRPGLNKSHVGGHQAPALCHRHAESRRERRL